jgi:non-ribosomal peptide synthetase component F
MANDIGTSEPSAMLVMHLVRARAQAAPNAPALVSGNQQLNYGELEIRSNQLAHDLQSAGVGPETLVGLCHDRGPAMVIAALAVLKAGGAYVPLDPAYPTDRLRFMLEDAKTPVLITRGEIGQRIGTGNWKVVNLDEDSSRIASRPQTPPAVPVSEQNLAYVIYTSGSTGRPKGVQITHKNLLNLISWHNSTFLFPQKIGPASWPVSRLTPRCGKSGRPWWLEPASIFRMRQPGFRPSRCAIGL